MSDNPVSYGNNLGAMLKFFRRYVKGHDQGHVIKTYVTNRKVSV